MKRRPKILVVGSFVMDQIATTAVFPRQGQTVLGESFRKAPGGKGANQAVQAARLGAEVTMVGKLGHDTNGAEMLRVCTDAGIDTSHILYDPTASSGCAIIVLETAPGASAQNRIIVIPGANMTFRPDEVAFLKDSIAQYDLVILQLEIPMEVNLTVAQYAHAAGVPVMLNPAPSAPLPDALLACLTYLSPNEHEAQDLSGCAIRRSAAGLSRADVQAAAAALTAKGVQNVLITLGDDGALLCRDGEQVHSPCCTGITAVDPTAAGDSFVAAFCVGTACGWTAEETLRFANHTAALTVSSMGAMPSLPKLSAVEALLRARGLPVPDTSALVPQCGV